MPGIPTSGSFHPDLTVWDAWRPEEAQRLLAEIEAPWYVAAGWAIDLFLGEQRREHEDLEIAFPSDRFGEVVEALGGFELFVVGPGAARPLAEAGDALDTYHQTWVLERGADVWRMDVFREPADGDTWICRRDESIRMPYDRLIERTDDGIPYARPEVILLFKAKHAHWSRNAGDLAAALPLLEEERRRWLAEALQLVHPGHRWLDEIGARF